MHTSYLDDIKHFVAARYFLERGLRDFTEVIIPQLLVVDNPLHHDQKLASVVIEGLSLVAVRLAVRRRANSYLLPAEGAVFALIVTAYQVEGR